MTWGEPSGVGLRAFAIGIGLLMLASTAGIAAASGASSPLEPDARASPTGCADEAERAAHLATTRSAVELEPDELRPAEQPRGYTDLEACTGLIQPGAEMIAPNVCTLNFVFTDGSGFFVGTAGHCVAEGDRVSAQDVGTFGTVVMQVYDGGADDFALIQVDESSEILVEPTMCTFGGPTGVQEDAYGSGLPVYEYGWGTATFLHPATRQRAHSHVSASGGLASWNGVGSGGDSGAPVIADGGDAYAIHTAGLTPVAGVALEGGPTVTHIQGLMADDGYGHLDLVEGDDFQRI